MKIFMPRRASLKLYSCDHCSKTYATLFSLRRHMYQYHQFVSDERQPTLTLPSKIGSKIYISSTNNASWRKYYQYCWRLLWKLIGRLNDQIWTARRFDCQTIWNCPTIWLPDGTILAGSKNYCAFAKFEPWQNTILKGVCFKLHLNPTKNPFREWCRIKNFNQAIRYCFQVSFSRWNNNKFLRKDFFP